MLDFNSLRLFSSLRMNTCKDVYQRWWPYCLPSTEARWLIRDGNGGAGREEGGGGRGRGRGSEGSTSDTARKRPERPWTAAARTMEVLRRCPLGIAQRLVHRAIAVSTAGAESQGQCPLHCSWGTIWRERIQLSFAAQLHLPAHDLFWANLRVQLHLSPLDLPVVMTHTGVGVGRLPKCKVELL